MTFQDRYWERKKLRNRRFPGHPVIREYVLPKIKEIRKVVNIDKGTRLLDAGAGNGFFSYYFDKICDTYAVDYSSRMLSMNPVKKKFLMDINKLGFEDEFFDVVFCHAVLHHTENIEKTVKEMKRVSKKYIVILEPNRNNPLMLLFSLLVPQERKAAKFSLGYLKRKIESTGVRVMSCFSYGMIVPNKYPRSLLWLAQLLNVKSFLGMTNFVIAEKKDENSTD